MSVPSAHSTLTQRQVAAALTLGWVMGELFYDPFPQPAPHDAEPPDHLPGLGHLRAYDRYRTRVARAEGMAAQVCCDAAIQAWADGIKAVEQAQLSQFKSDWGLKLAALHVQLLGAFAGEDMALCHAYDLGRSLCKTTRHPTTLHDLEEVFTTGRVDTMRARLSELTDLLPPHAASAVSSSLLTWRQWVAAGDRGNLVLDHSRRNLGSQGSLWLAVLTGEKSALSALNAADFMIAAKLVSVSLTRYAGNLAVSYLGPLVLVLLATAGLVVAVLYFPSAPAVIGALGGLAAALGITRKAAQVDGDTVLRHIMAKLWAEELDAAAAESLTQLPKSPKKSLGVEREPSRRVCRVPRLCRRLMKSRPSTKNRKNPHPIRSPEGTPLWWRRLGGHRSFGPVTPGSSARGREAAATPAAPSSPWRAARGPP